MKRTISTQKSTNRWWQSSAILYLLGCIAFAYPLMGYIITGTYARYIQDDYCYAAYLARYPFFEGQIFSYMHIDTYSGNRYSLNLLTGVSELFGRVSVQILPGLAVLLCLLGCVLLLHRIARLVGMTFSKPELLLAAMSLVFLALYQAPNLFQVLYWRAGMLPYLAPIITDLFLAALILRKIHRGEDGGLWFVLAGVLAFLAAGFSETAAAFQTGLAALSLVLAFLFMKRGSGRGALAVRYCAVVLTMTFIAMLVLIVSPINAKRLVEYPEPPNLFNFIVIAIDNSLQLLIYNAYRLTTLLVFTFVFFLLFALLQQSRERTIRFPFSQLVGWLLSIHIANFLLILCCVAPSVYFYSDSPDLRVLTAGQFTTTLSIACSGYLVGLCWQYYRRNLKERVAVVLELFFSAVLSSAIFFLLFFVPTTASMEPALPDIRSFIQQQPLLLLLPLLCGLLVVLLLLPVWKNSQPGRRNGFALALFLAVLFVQPLNGAKMIYDEIPLYRQRAELWDERDLEIRTAEINAERRITVDALDSMYGVADLQQHPDNWLNNCAEWYYGMEWISAVER